MTGILHNLTYTTSAESDQAYSGNESPVGRGSVVALRRDEASSQLNPSKGLRLFQRAAFASRLPKTRWISAPHCSRCSAEPRTATDSATSP